ncbi:uncharacterized protein UDID_18886 [Ustilago sp. UG-2017a]|nr:uncharacterized protein UDID_18886 [Ustilago sp. UG-2017a]
MVLFLWRGLLLLLLLLLPSGIVCTGETGIELLPRTLPAALPAGTWHSQLWSSDLTLKLSFWESNPAKLPDSSDARCSEKLRWFDVTRSRPLPSVAFCPRSEVDRMSELLHVAAHRVPSRLRPCSSVATDPVIVRDSLPLVIPSADA